MSAVKPLLITTSDGSVSALACRLSADADNPLARHILARGGVFDSDRAVLLACMRHGDAVGCIDPESWSTLWRGSARWLDPEAMQAAHRWLIDHLDELPDGAEIDPADLSHAMWSDVA